MVSQMQSGRYTYLLTLWEERRQDPQQSSVWRFSLEDPHTSQRCGFATLEALVEALQQLMKDQVDDAETGEYPLSPV